MESNTHTGITGKARETFALMLDHVLKDECSLSATTRDYRGNVTGPNLYSLHRLFDEQRRQLHFWLDQLVEHARSFGFGSAISLKADVPAAPDSESPAGAGLPARSMVVDLVVRHEEMAYRLRDNIEKVNEPTMAELLMRIVEFHETSAWMLRMVDNGSHPARAV